MMLHAGSRRSWTGSEKNNAGQTWPLPSWRSTACRPGRPDQLINSAWASLGAYASHSSPASREQEELDRRREEQRRADLATAQLEKHGLCALRGHSELASACEAENFMILRAPCIQRHTSWDLCLHCRPVFQKSAVQHSIHQAGSPL